MHLVTSVTPENHVSIGLRREEYGEVSEADMAVLSPTQARAYASQIVSRAELAERRAKRGA